MTITRGYLLAVIFVASACQEADTSGPRMILEEDSVSFAELTDYALSHERGAVVLVSTSKDKKRSSIVIRSVRFDERHDRTPEAVIEATKLALAAMPKATVTGPTSFEHDRYSAVRFDVSFEPREKHGTLYERRHAIVFADDHFYHVLHTAPIGHISDAADDFTRVVHSLREEG